MSYNQHNKKTISTSITCVTVNDNTGENKENNHHKRKIKSISKYYCVKGCKMNSKDNVSFLKIPNKPSNLLQNSYFKRKKTY